MLFLKTFKNAKFVVDGNALLDPYFLPFRIAAFTLIP